MSKTFKTAPYWVKVNSSPSTLVDDHNHCKDEPCDLPQTPIFYLHPGAPKTRCRWAEATEARVNPTYYCGCSMCTMQTERRAERRTARRRGRSYAKDGWRHEY